MPVDLSSLHGKAVLITGASRGYWGRSGARLCRRRGAGWNGCAGRRCAGRPCQGNRRAADLLRHGQFRSRVASGCPDAGPNFPGRPWIVLVNNAGVIDPDRTACPKPIRQNSGRLIDINLKGVFHGMRAALPVFLPQGGTIITVGSGAAYNPLEGWGAYLQLQVQGAWMLTRVAAVEAPASAHPKSVTRHCRHRYAAHHPR